MTDLFADLLTDVPAVETAAGRGNPSAAEVRHARARLADLPDLVLASHERDPAGFTRAYTDGSCHGNPDGPGGWAWFVDADRHASGGLARASNNVAELRAVLEVLRSAPLDVDLVVVSDSALAVGTVASWSDLWRALGWRRPAGKVTNLDLVRDLLDAREARTGETRFRRVRGHGRDASMSREHVEGNRRADELATAATRSVEAGSLAVVGPGWARS